MIKVTCGLILLSGCILGCREGTSVSVTSSVMSKASEKQGLTFPRYVEPSLDSKSADIILDSLLAPGEKLDLPDVSGCASVGFYIDEQFSAIDAGGRVRFVGGNGAECSPSEGAEWRSSDGSLINYSLSATNEGSQLRRILVYTTGK